MRYLLTRVYNNLPKNNKTANLEKELRLCIGTEYNEDEYRKFGQWFSELVESFNQRYDRTTPLTPLTTDSYFSAQLPNTDKCICLNFELIKRTYPELMRDVLGQDRC